MYLQMMWLMAVPKEGIERCLWCGEIIPPRQPEPPPLESKKGTRGKYKRRKDVKFCDNGGRCKGLYHYHNRVKPNQDAVS
jgi:hypothetical protein